MKIGINIWDQSSGNAQAAAFGSSQAIGDGKAAAEAVIAYLNAHGGIAGHPVSAVYSSFVATSSESWAAQRQSECSAFTEDNRVFAVVDQVDVIVDGMASCLAKSKTVYVNAYSRQMVGDTLLRQLAPYVYQPGDVTNASYGDALGLLKDSGYFDPGSKLGVLTVDDPITQAIYEKVLKPTLARFNIAIASDYALPAASALSDASREVQASQSAVVRFRAAGVDHVLMLTGGLGPLFFALAANDQGYAPRYAMTSKESFVLNGSVAPASQWHNAVLAGWLPTQDVDAQHDPNDSATRALCFRIIQQAGVAMPGRTAAHYFAVTCEGLFFLRAALAHSSSVSADSVRAGADALGATYGSALTFKTDFSNGRSSGARALRLARFDDSCACFKYTGGLVPLGD